MKPTRRSKLALHAETVRHLNAPTLAHAAGGAFAQRESADSKCVHCPLWTLPVDQCDYKSKLICPKEY